MTDTSSSAAEVRIASGPAWLTGDLQVPGSLRGVVLFAHGSGSGRHSARNRQVAQRFRQLGVATLLFDLLTDGEQQADDATRRHRFDIPLLARRMQDASDWAATQPQLRTAPLGYYGASTGSAAAQVAAARSSHPVAAIVSRGGRPDLAGLEALAAVRAPTLLIVGGADIEVLALNKWALERMACKRHLTVVPGASHLFEEPGTLEQAADAAAAWFQEHFTTRESVA